MINKSILYVGTSIDGSTSKSRLDSLIKKIKNVDIIESIDRTKISNKIKFKLNINFYEKIINQLLKRYKNYDLIWFDKPTFIERKILEIIKEKKISLVCHITDDIDNQSHNMVKLINSLDLYDFIFTCNKFNIESYPNYKFFYNELGYDHNDYYFNLTDITLSQQENLISFFGHYEKHYLNIIEKLSGRIGTNLKINIGGVGWWKVPKLFLNKKIKLKYGWINKDQMIKEYRNSVACIGLYSEVNRNLTSGRIFEMAALGLPIISKPNIILDNLLEDSYIKLHKNYEDLNDKLIDVEYLNVIRKKANNLIKEKKCSWSDRIDECLKIIGYEK